MNILTCKCGFFSLLAPPRSDVIAGHGQQCPSRFRTDHVSHTLNGLRHLNIANSAHHNLKIWERPSLKTKFKRPSWGTFGIAPGPALRHRKHRTRTAPTTWHQTQKPISGATLVSREWMTEHVSSWLTLMNHWTLLQVSRPSIILHAPPALRWWGWVEFSLLLLPGCAKNRLPCFVASGNET